MAFAELSPASGNHTWRGERRTHERAAAIAGFEPARAYAAAIAGSDSIGAGASFSRSIGVTASRPRPSAS